MLEARYAIQNYSYVGRTARDGLAKRLNKIYLGCAALN